MTKAQDKELFNKNKRSLKAKLPEKPICPYCNCLMVSDNSSPYALVSIDHIVAYSKGGTDELDNLLACCGNCNTKKGNNPQAVMFRIDHPKLLRNNEYEILNDYITVSSRINVLEELKIFLMEKNYNQALLLTKTSQQKTTSKSFFSKLEESLKNCLAIKDIKTQENYLMKEVIVRLKAEKDKMTEIKEQSSYLHFSTYCLLG